MIRKPLTEEHKEKIRIGNLGVKRNYITRLRMGLAQKGNKKWLGRKHKEETKIKIANGNRGKIVSEETKEKLRQALLGKQWDIERRLEWSNRKKGEGNNNWKGGITSIHRKLRMSWKYRLWSENIRKRDGKCLNCGSMKNLHAHHIERFLLNKEKQYDLDNGITLCAKCHYIYHRKNGGNSGT